MPAPAMDPFEAYGKHVNPALGRFHELTGRGTRFVFGSLNLGHNPPRIKAAMLEHLRRAVPSLYPESLNPFAGSLAARLIAATSGAFETGEAAP